MPQQFFKAHGADAFVEQIESVKIFGVWVHESTNS
jgi:hypothetical protein